MFTFFFQKKQQLLQIGLENRNNRQIIDKNNEENILGYACSASNVVNIQNCKHCEVTKKSILDTYSHRFNDFSWKGSSQLDFYEFILAVMTLNVFVKKSGLVHLEKGEQYSDALGKMCICGFLPASHVKYSRSKI